jgi:hypothetical protein
VGPARAPVAERGRSSSWSALASGVLTSKYTRADLDAGPVGLTRSQLVQEAVMLYLKAIMDLRNGRQVAVIDSKSQTALVERPHSP